MKHTHAVKWPLLAVGALLIGLLTAVPAQAAGGIPGGGGAARPVGGLNSGRPVVIPPAPAAAPKPAPPPAPAPAPAPAQAPATTSLTASLVGTPTHPAAAGTINIVKKPRVALSGDVANTGLALNTWVDLVIDGVYVQSEPIQALTSALTPNGAAFVVERLPGKAAAAGLTAPTLQFLSTVHAGSTVVVRVTTTTTPLGVVGSVPLSPLAGQVVATGTFH